MDAITREPLSDVLFKITRLDGTAAGASNGEYRTDANGYIALPDLEPGGYIIAELQTASGYVLDNTPKTIEIKDHQTYTMDIFNQPKGGLVIQKRDGKTREPLQGVEFKITTASGELVSTNEGLTSSNGIYSTDANGQIVLRKLQPGTYIVTETKTLDDYILDPQSQTVVVGDGDTQTLNFENTPKGCLVVKKIDGVTKEPIAGVKFEVKGAEGCEYPAGIYTTDANGMFRLSHIPSGCYAITETEAKKGYRLDNTVKTVEVEGGVCKEITFENEPLGGLLIKKMDAVTKAPLSDVLFKITKPDGAAIGVSNGEFRTDEYGYISLPDLQPGTYVIKETQAKPGYVLDDTPKTITISDHQTYNLEIFNQPAGGLIVRKIDSKSREPLSGVQFQITTASGELVPTDGGLTSSNGIYTTDAAGEIRLNKLTPGTYIVKEARFVP